MAAPARLQLIVAHPDDETFGCGSLLLHAAELGMHTSVVCATRGEEGGDDAHRGAELGKIRAAEMQCAAELLQVSEVELLSFTDSGMSGPPPPGSLMAAPVDEVEESVAAQIRAFRPDIVVTLDASDSHRDHVRMRDAVRASAKREGVPTVYLSCLPRSLMRRWVAEMRVGRPEMEHLDADVAAMGTPDELITHRIDAVSHLDTREQAIAIHASQTSPFEGLSADLRRAFLGDIHLRQVEPACPSGPVRAALHVG